MYLLKERAMISMLKLFLKISPILQQLQVNWAWNSVGKLEVEIITYKKEKYHNE